MGDRKSFFLCMLVSIACSTSFANAAAIPWRVEVQDAVSEATKSGKPLLISVSTDWCHYCKKMDIETFSNARVADHIQKCFVPVKIDGDKNRELVRMLGVQSFPTMVILTPKMKVLGTMKGFRTPDQLNAALESICTASEVHGRTPLNANSRTPNNSQRVETSLMASPFEDHCPVTSFHSKRLVKSNESYTAPYRGYLVTFASDKARQRFLDQPDQYWPLLDGRCVVSALDDKTLRTGTWEHGVSFANRIWFMSSEEHMRRFSKQPEEYLDRLAQLMKSNQSK